MAQGLLSFYEASLDSRVSRPGERAQSTYGSRMPRKGQGLKRGWHRQTFTQTTVLCFTLLGAVLICALNLLESPEIDRTYVNTLSRISTPVISQAMVEDLDTVSNMTDISAEVAQACCLEISMRTPFFRSLLFRRLHFSAAFGVVGGASWKTRELSCVHTSY